MRLHQLVRLRWLLTALLIAGAALFTMAVAAERNAGDDHPEVAASGESSETNENAEVGEAPAANESPEAHSAEARGAEAEKVLGIDVESTPLVLLAVGASIAFAVAVWSSDRRSVLLAAGLFALVFAVLDVTEVAHQVGESRAGIAVLAALIALVHLAATFVAQGRRTSGKV